MGYSVEWFAPSSDLAGRGVGGCLHITYDKTGRKDVFLISHKEMSNKSSERLVDEHLRLDLSYLRVKNAPPT